MEFISFLRESRLKGINMKAIITKTETFILDLESPCWPEGMTDQDKLTGWIFAARMEPEVAFKCLEPSSIEIDGVIE